MHPLHQLLGNLYARVEKCPPNRGSVGSENRATVGGNPVTSSRCHLGLPLETGCNVTSKEFVRTPQLLPRCPFMGEDKQPAEPTRELEHPFDGFDRIVWATDDDAPLFAAASKESWCGSGGRPNVSSKYSLFHRR